MKILIYLLSVFFLITGSVSVSAATKTPIYSASINKDGTLAAQSPHWIESIEYSSQPDYAASYKVNLMPDAFQKEPKFCVASTYDNSSYETYPLWHRQIVEQTDPIRSECYRLDAGCQRAIRGFIDEFLPGVRQINHLTKAATLLVFTRSQPLSSSGTAARHGR